MKEKDILERKDSFEMLTTFTAPDACVVRDEKDERPEEKDE